MNAVDPHGAFVQIYKRYLFFLAVAILHQGAWLGDGNVGKISVLHHP